MKQWLTLGLLVMLALIGGGVAAQDAPLDEETFFLTFVPNVQFAPAYVALERGYFADAGIDLTIEHGDEPVGVDLIAAGQRNFGMIGGEQVIAARARERDVVMVYQWFHEFPIAVVYDPASGITSAADLVGRTVGVPGRFGATYSGLVALLVANGLTPDDVQIQEIGFSAPEVFCLGRVEASAVYINNEPLQIANRIAADDCGDVTGVAVLPVAEQANIVSNGIMTSAALIEENPDLVRRFVGAFDAGLRAAILYPAETYLISLNYVETLPVTDEFRAALEAAAIEDRAFYTDNADAVSDPAARADRRAALFETLAGQFGDDQLLQMRVLLETINLWEAERLGEMNLDDWVITQDTLITMGFVEDPIDVSSAFTNDFLPPVTE